MKDIKNVRFLREILEAKEIDQQIRKRAKMKGRNVFNFLYYVIDRLHNYLIKAWISCYGFPTQRVVGKEGMDAFWILVMHQFFDIKLQERCLRHCDFEPQDKAKLTDRILALQGKKQKYGTFVNKKQGRFVLHPVENMVVAERARKMLGFPPIPTYLSVLNKKRK